MKDFILVKIYLKKIANAIFAVKCSILLRFSNFKKLAFAELSEKSNHMSKLNVRLIGTAQWYFENEGFYFG